MRFDVAMDNGGGDGVMQVVHAEGNLVAEPQSLWRGGCSKVCEKGGGRGVRI